MKINLCKIINNTVIELKKKNKYCTLKGNYQTVQLVRFAKKFNEEIKIYGNKIKLNPYSKELWGLDRYTFREVIYMASFFLAEREITEKNKSRKLKLDRLKDLLNLAKCYKKCVSRTLKSNVKIYCEDYTLSEDPNKYFNEIDCVCNSVEIDINQCIKGIDFSISLQEREVLLKEIINDLINIDNCNLAKIKKYIRKQGKQINTKDLKFQSFDSENSKILIRYLKS